MKPTMLFAIILITVIILASAFDLTLSTVTPVAVPDNLIGAVLYVCPIDNTGVWHTISAGLRPFSRYITIAFFFALIMLFFLWGWGIYQNLLKDKFNKDQFVKPWEWTKMLFWAGVIVLLLINTPNHYKTVHITGVDGSWILCENTTPGARPVRSNAVKF